MRAVCLGLALAACFASTVESSYLDIIDDNPTVVHIQRKNALLPCTCADGVLDCSERGKFELTVEDQCSGPVSVLNLYDNELSAIPTGFHEATIVNISKNQLTLLPLPSQLSPRVKVLNLYDNEISNSSIELRSLVSLETLIVSDNNELRSLQFLPLPCGLRHLEASRINLQNLQGPLTQCALLETLDLSRNGLTVLPEDTFYALTQLRSLDLGRNSIETVPDRLFVTLTQLRSLALNNNNLKLLAANVFSSLSNLKTLNLMSNSFKTLPSGIFSPLTRLTDLILINNTLDTFPTSELANLPSLETLNLALSKLNVMPENAFSSNPRLQELNLMFNNISSLPQNIFSGHTRLNAVMLHSNSLQLLPENLFSDARNLTFVFLPCISLSNNLRVVENASHILYAQCGRIELSSAMLSVFSRLEWLALNENQIISIAEDAFAGLPLLKNLFLGQNNITELPAGIFSHVPHLHGISLMRNRITTIPNGLFSGLQNLTRLTLAGNPLTELEENVFRGLTALEAVDLSDNLLTSVPPNLFAGLPSLKEVNLEDTQLSALPAFSPVWGAIPAVSFSFNKLALSRASLRPWLEGAGAQGPRYVGLTHREGQGPAPASLRWLLHEPGVALAPGGARRCRCGAVRRGPVLLRVCVAVRCGEPPLPRDWLEAVRAADRESPRLLGA